MMVKAAYTVSQFGFCEVTRCRMLPGEEHVCPPLNVTAVCPVQYCLPRGGGQSAARDLTRRVCAGSSRSEVKPWQPLTAVASLCLRLVSVGV